MTKTPRKVEEKKPKMPNDQDTTFLQITEKKQNKVSSHFYITRRTLITLYVGFAACFSLLMTSLLWSFQGDPTQDQLSSIFIRISFFALFLSLFATKIAFLAMVLCVEYYFILRPLRLIQEREHDPLAVFDPMIYPSYGLRGVHFILGIYSDYKLQREAFHRLIEAYRSLSLLPKEIKMHRLFKIPIEHELAIQMKVCVYDQKFANLTGVHPKVLAEKLSEELAPDFQRSIAILQTSDEADFVFESKLYVLQKSRESSHEILVGVIEPRKLWSRFPKVFRRFFHVFLQICSEHDQNSLLTKTDMINPDKTLFSPGLSPSLSPDFSPENHSPIFLQLELHDTKSSSRDPANLPVCVGFAHTQLPYVHGDFLALFYSEPLQSSIVILGNVPGQSIEARLAANGVLAIVSALAGTPRTQRDRKETNSKSLSIKLKARKTNSISRNLNPPSNPFNIKDIVSALNCYSQSHLNRSHGISLTAIAFNHSTGTGELLSYGQPFPYILSPQERRPLILVPEIADQQPLGLRKEIEIQPTSFNIFPGQMLFVCSASINHLRDLNNRTFEKEINRGKLASLSDGTVTKTASEISQDYLSLALDHAGNQTLSENLSLFCLGPYDSFKPTDLLKQ